MQRNDARLQMLTLALLAVFGMLSLGLAPVQAVMHDYGLIDSHEAIAEEEAAPTPWAAEAPSLAVGGETPAPAESPKAEPSCCPGELVIDAWNEHIREGRHVAQWAEALTTPDLATKPVKTPIITSLWPETPCCGWTTLDEAGKALDLSDDQRASWEVTLQDAKHDLDDLGHVPNSDGVTWHQVTTAAIDPQTAVRDALTKVKAIAEFMTSELNGGGTYADERRRLIDSYKDRLRGDLTPKQVRVFDAHPVDGLIDPASVSITQRTLLGARPVMQRAVVVRFRKA